MSGGIYSQQFRCSERKEKEKNKRKREKQTSNNQSSSGSGCDGHLYQVPPSTPEVIISLGVPAPGHVSLDSLMPLITNLIYL
jgi:hypothetical protein